jgi:hypothetical protein
MARIVDTEEGRKRKREREKRYDIGEFKSCRANVGRRKPFTIR